MSCQNSFSNMSKLEECPICMDDIESKCNRVATECGHVFHCSCLMKNAAHNGFGCPLCRFKMADEPEEEEEDFDEDDDEELSVFEDDALTSFRMFHQRLSGEDVEEEPEDDWSTISGEEEEEDINNVRPDATYMTEKLLARGITFEDLVKNILFQEHGGFGQIGYYNNYERRSAEVFGQFRAIISQFTPQNQASSTETQAPSIQAPPAYTQNILQNEPTIQAEAESKPVTARVKREFMVHV